jgi:hypothetical protein
MSGIKRPGSVGSTLLKPNSALPLNKAVPWLRWRSVFAPGSVHVEFFCGQSVTRIGFYPNSSVFPCQYNFTGGCPYSCIIWSMNNRLIGVRNSERQSHSIDMNNIL